jgi:hypothetical protein
MKLYITEHNHQYFKALLEARKHFKKQIRRNKNKATPSRMLAMANEILKYINNNNCCNSSSLDSYLVNGVIYLITGLGYKAVPASKGII